MLLSPVMPKAPSRVLLVDDHPIVGLGVETLLDGCDRFELLGKAEDHHAARRLSTQWQPDLIILDLLLGGRDGLELISELLENAGAASIIIYSSLPEGTHARRAFRAGARGYVMKEAGLHALLEALETVACGEPYASAAVKQSLLEECIGKKSPGNSRVESLSNQELHIFRLIGSGLGSLEIAAQLSISPKTVSSHRERIKNKLGLPSGRELVRRAEDFFRAEA